MRQVEGKAETEEGHWCLVFLCNVKCKGDTGNNADKCEVNLYHIGQYDSGL